MSESVIKVARRTNRGGTGVKRPRSPAEVIKRHECDQPDCDKKFKRAGHLKQHKADVHGIDVV